MGKQLSSVEWARIGRDYDEKLVYEVKNLLESGTSTEINPKYLVSATSDIGKVKQLLNRLAVLELISKKEVRVCPTTDCNNILDDDDINVCPRCHTDFRQTGDEPQKQIKYLTVTNISRDVPWLIAIHGMNTDGKWQEEFSWRIANKFRYHAPVLIFKYGLVRYRVLFPFFHKMITRRLGKKIFAAIDHARQNGIKEPPDIVVHSFGSLLFSCLLQHKDFETLKFGRVIVAGGIISPNFNWSKFLDVNRIEAVLNHCSEDDNIVRYAQYFIPNSGPSGEVGASDPKVINVLDTRYGHSSYFDPLILAENLGENGVWDTFLRYPLSSLSTVLPVHQQDVTWSSSNMLVKFLSWILAIAIVPILLLIAMIILLKINALFFHFVNYLGLMIQSFF